MSAVELEESTTYIKKPHVKSFIDKELSAARDVLLNHIFIGFYKDRRYVVPLKEYRDVVTISSAELKLIADLDAVKKDLQRIYDVKWLGITGSEAEPSKSGYSFWVKLKNVPFGCFWFQIKEIKYENEEIILRLKCLRPVRPQDYEGALEDVTQKLEDSKNFEDLVALLKIKMCYAVLKDFIQQVILQVTLTNFVMLCKFITTLGFVLIFTLFTYIGHIGDYSLKLLRQVTLLLIAITPYFIHTINCITKVIGGIFILMALMLRGRGDQRVQVQSDRRLVSYPRERLYAGFEQGSDVPANRTIIMTRN